MDNYIMRFTSAHSRIACIKSIRHIFGIGLKESKALMEGRGFVVTDLQRCALLGAYLTERLNANCTAEALLADWSWTLHDDVVFEDMTRANPLSRATPFPTRKGHAVSPQDDLGPF